MAFQRLTEQRPMEMRNSLSDVILFYHLAPTHRRHLQVTSRRSLVRRDLFLVVAPHRITLRPPQQPCGTPRYAHQRCGARDRTPSAGSRRRRRRSGGRCFLRRFLLFLCRRGSCCIGCGGAELRCKPWCGRSGRCCASKGRPLPRCHSAAAASAGSYAIEIYSVIL